MTLLEIQNLLRDRVRETAVRTFSIDLGEIASEIPPKTELGDLAFPVAFELAKLIKQQTGEKQNPRAIAEVIKTELESFDFVDRVEIAGPGYLNIFFDRALFLLENLDSEPISICDASGPKVCVEHTSVNPNKAAHIGHVRNSVLGDTFQRILKATGKRVEVQNYIDNTGVQVADVVVGFVYLENRDLYAIKTLDSELSEQGVKFDYYCWDLYAKVGQAYQIDEELKAKRAEVLHLIEEGNNDIARLADHVATRNVQCITDTMERFGIRYDLLPRESEILHLKFWDRAFEQMKQLGVIHYETEGKNAGCWVMPFEEHTGTDDHESDKILVRSNGTVTYTGKDIAYQMWKLGILGMDFHYKRFHRYADGKELWITTSDVSEAEGDHLEFGHGETVYNVIDTRQSYPQEIVKKGVAAIDPVRGELASVHLSYEMVALSPAAAAELGFQLSEEDKARTFVEMSGRKGLGVKADDLLDRLEEKALVEVEARHPAIPSDEKKKIAHQIAVGALRYFLLKFTRNTVIVFDFKEALSFDGETGCFCQYSCVRANSIFRKLEERGESLETIRTGLQERESVARTFAHEDGKDIWALLLMALRLEETLISAARTNEPAILTKYAFNLAKSFNLFYHNHKIIPEPDATKRAILITVADLVRRSLTAALETMGIEIPEKM
ncbi:arginine--tRNA ligase [Leptolyngbya sp. 7M]|uniref:arginine--tRNA ligase n=1 Tax=Leptolyngbya sp. 7M TaxID=2812896 RepID=UPI001B8AD59A|nr:arginine--tRNA ligase [Leptolyngbya sp. 7M]QYO65488.1 arginine--tRNA ligase [Leptolyngbya sp. 7M]